MISAMNRSAKIKWSWALYDWANSSFSAVIITFIFSVYFAESVVGDEIRGTALWSYTIAASGIIVALLAPVLGGISDYTERRKMPLVLSALLCIVATACLWIAPPGASLSMIYLILILVCLANIGVELSLVFYNAMLPDIAEKEEKGKLSGMAWALGYAGGLACLLLVLFVFIGLGDIKPLIKMSQEEAAHIRIVAPFTALWVLLFSLPLFLFVREKSVSTARNGKTKSTILSNLKNTINTLKNNTNMTWFLLSSALYRDGLVTLFAVGGLYAAGVYNMDFQEILLFAIALNVTAGIGAMAMARLDDLWGSKRVIVMSLLGLIVTATVILLTSDKILFLGLALFLGLFMGPVQSASRVMVSHLSDQKNMSQSYGLYAFTGKSIAFVGPLLYGMATEIFNSQQAGMLSIIMFWVAGLLLLTKVKINENH